MSKPKYCILFVTGQTLQLLVSDKHIGPSPCFSYVDSPLSANNVDIALNILGCYGWEGKHFLLLDRPLCSPFCHRSTGMDLAPYQAWTSLSYKMQVCSGRIDITYLDHEVTFILTSSVTDRYYISFHLLEEIASIFLLLERETIPLSFFSMRGGFYLVPKLRELYILTILYL